MARGRKSKTTRAEGTKVGPREDLFETGVIRFRGPGRQLEDVEFASIDPRVPRGDGEFPESSRSIDFLAGEAPPRRQVHNPFLKLDLEAAGIEPASEKRSISTSTCVFGRLILVPWAPADRILSGPASKVSPR